MKSQDRHLFYAILKSRYFDYSPVLNSFCEAVDDVRLHGIISDLQLNNFPDAIVADCICSSAKNGPWKDESLFPVNPIISKHFNPADWSSTQIREFFQSALRTQNHEARWDAILKQDSTIDQKSLSFYFESEDLWLTIQSQYLQKADRIVRILVESVLRTTGLSSNDDIKLLICKLILIGSIRTIDHFVKSDAISEMFNYFIQIRDSIDTDKIELKYLNDLFLHLNNPDNPDTDTGILALNDLLSVIEPVSSAATVLNFMSLFSKQVEDDQNLFEQLKSAFFNGNFMIPTVQETCSFIKVSKDPIRIEGIIKNHPNILRSLYLECPELIPPQSIRKHISYQVRLETTLRKHRKLVISTATSVHFKLPPSSLLPRDRLKFIVKELELFNNDKHGFKAYNYPVKVFRKTASFVFAIDCFFDSFLESEFLYHVIAEDSSIVPNLINLNPKLMESFGYFMASSIILQHPLKFQLNQFYFNLMRSSFKPQFNHFLFEIYPSGDLELVARSMLYEGLKIGVVNLYSGFLKAFEVEQFSLKELNKLFVYQK